MIRVWHEGVSQPIPWNSLDESITVLEVTFDSMSSLTLTLCEFKTTAETSNHRHHLLEKTIKAMTVESEARMSHQDLLCLHQQLVIHNSSSSYWNHRSTIDFTLRTTLTFLYSFIIPYLYVIGCRFALAHFVQICWAWTCFVLNDENWIHTSYSHH